MRIRSCATFPEVTLNLMRPSSAIPNSTTVVSHTQRLMIFHAAPASAQNFMKSTP